MKREKTKRNTSIQGKIQYSVILLLTLSLLLGGTVAVYESYSSTYSLLEQTMEKLASVAADRVLWEMKSYESVAFEIGSVARLANPEGSLESKRELLDSKVETYDLVEAHLIDANGINIFSGIDSHEREYFKRAMAGETYISEPSISKSTGKLSVLVAAPLWENGLPNTKPVGVVLLIPQEDFLNEIVNSITVSKNTYVYMIDKNGVTIADKTIELVAQGNNIEELAKTNSSYKSLAAIHSRMRAGENGSVVHRKGLSKYVMAFAPVGENGWSIAVEVKGSDFMGSTIFSMLLIIIIMLGSVAVGITIVRKLAGNIGNPIKECAEHLKLLAGGNLSIEELSVQTEDETKILADAANSLAQSLSGIIRDVDYMFGEMGEGNFTVSSKAEGSYVGDFSQMKSSVYKLTDKLSQTMRYIKQSSEQVSSGSAQLAESSQGLAEGATEQAGAVEELQATIMDVTEQIKVSAQEQKKTYDKAQEVETVAGVSSQDMDELKQAMHRISNTSTQIGSIITDIEEIAAQTNLLALNAAIEAARAGEAGKGFAVVADEIRKLAEGSARSVETTRELIQTAIAEVQSGNELTDKTAVSLEQVIEGLNLIEESIKEVAGFSSKQAEAMGQIEQGINQISEVVQNNSALAEESSATSQEFLAQSITLNDLVEQFKIK